MNRCPDLVVCLKRDLQCLRPEASLVLIYRPNVAGMKGRVDLAQPVNRTPDLWCGSTTRSYSLYCRLQIIRCREVGIEKLQDFSTLTNRIFVCGVNKIENCDRRKRADRRGKPHWPELREINKWILKERDDGKAVSTVSIRMKARVIAREMVVQRLDRNYLMTGKNNWTTF
ncbi:hypothetical protein TNCV_1066261 [Trichonephila clavipes]|nr:hypothetical protein TNCV_1066261 [Trichonephila clavipes]